MGRAGSAAGRESFGTDVAEKIAQEVAELHRRLGAGERVVAPAIHVALNERFVAVLRELRLSGAEVALLRAGRERAVRETHEGLAMSLADHYGEIVARLTGRAVDSFACSVGLEGRTPWSSEVLVFDREAG